MFKIVNGNIYHTRGDTADFEVEIESEDGPVTAVFSVKRFFKDKNYVFQVNVEDNHVHIPSSLTKNLYCDRYIYDIEVHIDDGTEEGRIITIGPYQYHLLPDVSI